MATKAYVLLKIRTGKTKDVVTALNAVSSVKQVHSCFGQPDVFCFVDVQDEKALSDLVIRTIHTIDGVDETDTHIVADAA